MSRKERRAGAGLEERCAWELKAKDTRRKEEKCEEGIEERFAIHYEDAPLFRAGRLHLRITSFEAAQRGKIKELP